MTRVPIDDVGEQSRRWVVLARATGLLGLVSVLLLFGALIPVSSLGEPPLAATSEEAAAFFGNAAEAAWVQAAEATGSLGALVFLWFVVGLGLILRRAEGDPPWRSAIAVASGLVFAAYGVLDASWDAAIRRGAELDSSLAGYAFDVGNIGFANAWLAMGGLALAAGWVVVSTRVLPRWTGWCAIAGGAGLVVARYLWFVEGLWFLPYSLFWVWVIGSCVRLLRRARTFA